MFSVKMFVSRVSRRGNRCAQLYATGFEWVKAFPMASRSEAYKTLLLLFAEDGVLPACICNNAKMIKSKFYKKLKNSACHLKWLESNTPWSNAEEREIKELKKGAGHKLLQSRAPKCLLDGIIRAGSIY